MAFGEQALAQVRAEEAGAAGDEDAFAGAVGSHVILPVRRVFSSKSAASWESNPTTPPPAAAPLLPEEEGRLLRITLAFSPRAGRGDTTTVALALGYCLFMAYRRDSVSR